MTARDWLLFASAFVGILAVTMAATLLVTAGVLLVLAGG